MALVGARYFDDPLYEINRIIEMERQFAQRRNLKFAPETAATLARNVEVYPWMRPGVQMSLAKAGYGPDHAVTQQAASTSAKVKKKKGFWGSLGDVVTAPAREAVDLVQDVGGAVGGAAAPVARGVFAGLQLPYESVQGAFRVGTREVREEGWIGGLSQFLPGATSPETFGDIFEQTSVGIATDKLLHGESVDMGSGYFVGGEIREEQAEAARAVASINGQAVTPGRLFAATITEPGTKPYKTLSGLVDMGVSLYGDPANLALGKVAQVQKARKFFTLPNESIASKVLSAAGAIDQTPRKTVMADLVRNWMDDPRQDQLWQKMADDKSFYSLWEQTGKKLDVSLLKRVADEADTPEKVKDLLRPVLGVTGGGLKPTYGGFGVSVRRNMNGVRLAQGMPGHKIDLNDRNQAVETMDRWLKNAMLPKEKIEQYTSELAGAPGRWDAYKVVKRALEDTQGVLAQAGLDERTTRKLTTMWEDYHDAVRHYYVNEVGHNVAVPGAVIDNTGFIQPTPHFYSEGLNGHIPLPDPRQIRKATREFKFLNHPAIDVPTSGLINLQEKFLKPMWLVTRVAWPVRVIGEEQLRMGGAGLESMFRHPLSYIAWRIGRKEDAFGHDITTAAGRFEDIADHAKALNHGTAGWTDTGWVRTQDWTTYSRNHEMYPTSWGDELAGIYADPVARRVAGGWAEGDAIPGGLTGNSVEDAKRWFWEGPGKTFREEMADAFAPGLRVRGGDNGADKYIDSIADRIRIKTSENTELKEAVRTGKLRGVPMTDGDRLGKDFKNLLGEMASEGIGPERIKGQRVLASKRASNYDRVVDIAFATLYSERSNNLSRSPTFRQSYWEEMKRLTPFLRGQDQGAVMRQAESMGMSRKFKKELADAISRSKDGTLKLDEADWAAKGHALDFTKNLLYDLTEKSQFFDATRLIFPFGEAWKEVLTRWAKLAQENPKVVRRFQQTVEGARGSGFFYNDPQSGEEMFAYPGTDFISKAITGVEVPMQGKVAGLNLFSSNPLVPGFGPVVQIPAAALIPDQPDWDFVRDTVIPFGDPEIKEGFLESFMPAWMKYAHAAMFQDPDLDRQLGSATFEVARYLLATGKGDISTEEGQITLTAEATKRARMVMVFRAMMSSSVPSAPSPKWLAQDKDGKVWTSFKLAEEFRKLYDEDPDEAVSTFIDTYGDDALLYMQGKSSGNFQPTGTLHEWVRTHGDIVKRFPKSYGFFAPASDDANDFSFNEYQRQINAGERDIKTPKEAIEIANARVAAMIYKRAKEKVGDRTDTDATIWLQEVRDELRADYPGYHPELFEIGKTEHAILELEQAAKVPELASTPAGEALATYLEARDKATAAARNLGGNIKGFQRAKAASHLRQWLREIADDLVDETPSFAPMWDRVFSRELVDDEPISELVA